MQVLGWNMVVVLSVVGCASAPRTPVSQVRFANAPPVWLVNDRKPVDVQPAKRPDVGTLRGFDIAVTDPLAGMFAAAGSPRAMNTNSFDEVPSSTWFVNRIGSRTVSLDEMGQGPNKTAGPDLSRPLRVTRGKDAGMMPGFIAEDAAGVRWLIKFDPAGVAMDSAADVASQRLLWAAGYYVPENHAFYLRRADVVVASDAKLADARGRKRAMTMADLDATFARAIVKEHGYRVMASRMIDGTPIGGTPLDGVRADDPNDTVPHEHRREWRGLHVFTAWLQHTDFKEMGTLDVWAPDPVDASRKVVLHYLVDFGNTLGAYTRVRRDDGHTEQVLDLDHLKSLASFGLWRRPWEGVVAPGIRGVGAFDVDHFDPGGFQPYQRFPAFSFRDATDALWAVKILLRFSAAHVRTALEAARYEDPRAVDYLTRVLIGRQRKLARYWFERIAPIDAPVIEGDRLCFRDLAVVHGLTDQRSRRYRATSFDWTGASLGDATLGQSTADGTICTSVARGEARDGYTIVRIVLAVGDRDYAPVEVHVANAPDGKRRVIGIERHLAR